MIGSEEESERVIYVSERERAREKERVRETDKGRKTERVRETTL